jgi:hypothetical protein
VRSQINLFALSNLPGPGVKRVPLRVYTLLADRMVGLTGSTSAQIKPEWRRDWRDAPHAVGRRALAVTASRRRALPSDAAGTRLPTLDQD